MIKKAIYDLIILMFISFQIVSCDSTASGTSGTSAINKIDYTLDQVFFNRLIFDYYHQIIEEPKSSDFYMYQVLALSAGQKRFMAVIMMLT